MSRVRVSVNDMALYDFMTKHNLSQKDLAGRLGISESYISQILCRIRHPSPKLRRRMLEVMAPQTFQDLFTVEDRKAEIKTQHAAF